MLKLLFLLLLTLPFSSPSLCTYSPALFPRILSSYNYSNGILGFVSHLSPLPFNLEMMTALTFLPQAAVISHNHSPTMSVMRSVRNIISLTLPVRLLALSGHKELNVPEDVEEEFILDIDQVNRLLRRYQRTKGMKHYIINPGENSTGNGRKDPFKDRSFKDVLVAEAPIAPKVPKPTPEPEKNKRQRGRKVKCLQALGLALAHGANRQHRVQPDQPHFMLVLSVLPTFCQSANCIKYPAPRLFTTHGIWPLDERGEVLNNENCNAPRSPAESDDFKLASGLAKLWPSYKKGQTARQLWINEYNKHGRCKFSKEDYIGLAKTCIPRFHQYRLFHFEANKSYSREQWEESVATHFHYTGVAGIKPLSCGESGELKELKFCFEVDKPTVIIPCKSHIWNCQRHKSISIP